MTHPATSDDTMPPGDDTPIFDRAEDDLPWQPDDALRMDDDGNILPGNDPLDDDPNDNGDMEPDEIDDVILSQI